MQNLLYARQIDLRILGEWMVSMHQESRKSQQPQPEDRFPFRQS